MPIKRVRSKPCDRCAATPDALYRVRTERDGAWRFVCRRCLLVVRSGNPHYQYGGTWKSKKRH